MPHHTEPTTSGPTPNPNSPSPSSHTHLTTPAAIIPTHAATALTINTHHMVIRVKAGISKPLAPVVKLATIHTVLSLTMTRDWPIHQLDVKNAFLHGQLAETVYMHQPPASSTALLQRIITLLHSEFAMTDLGSLNYFLGISAQRSKSRLFLSQSKFAAEILERAHMQHCNPCKTPMDT
ncbi:ribonuclease H-like domain-containing protein [Tanacetum coccineum]